MAENMGMEKMRFLDIGGGFTMLSPSRERNFLAVAPKIAALIDKEFPDPDIQVIGEPGRYICESVVYLASKIIGTKVMPNGHHHYYVNNGIYQGYMVRVFGEDMLIEPLDKEVEKRKKHKTTFWG